MLSSGEYLPEWQLYYEAFGKLSEKKDNVVVVHHALSVGSHLVSTDLNPDKGWWQQMVDPGKPIDTEHYYVICINNLGSCFGSSGPVSINSETGERWGSQFPQVSVTDMVASQQALLTHLEIEQLYAVIGNSMGAMLSLSWAIDFPATVKRLLLTSSCYKAYPANIANRNIQQELIRMDPAFNAGNYESDTNLTGFKLARMLGLFTYRNAAEWNRRFNSFDQDGMRDDEINNYMDYNADVFCRSFDANSYIVLTTAMDFYNVTNGYDSMQAAFSRIKAKTTVISVESDILFTPQQQQELYQALQTGKVDTHYIDHQSQYGHDSFLVEIEAFGIYLRQFLQ